MCKYFFRGEEKAKGTVLLRDFLEQDPSRSLLNTCAYKHVHRRACIYTCSRLYPPTATEVTTRVYKHTHTYTHAHAHAHRADVRVTPKMHTYTDSHTSLTYTTSQIWSRSTLCFFPQHAVN